MLNPYIWLAGLLIVIGSVSGGYLYGHHAAVNECKADKLKSLQTLIAEQDKITTENNAIAFAGEVKTQARREKVRTIIKRIKVDEAKHPEYDTCRLSPDGLRDLQSAINPSDDSGQPSGAMPGETTGTDNGNAQRSTGHDDRNSLDVPRLPTAPKRLGGIFSRFFGAE